MKSICQVFIFAITLFVISACKKSDSDQLIIDSESPDVDIYLAGHTSPLVLEQDPRTGKTEQLQFYHQAKAIPI